MVWVLSIIKKIIDTNHWNINYYFIDRMHTFEIVFKIQYFYKFHLEICSKKIKSKKYHAN